MARTLTMLATMLILFSSSGALAQTDDQKMDNVPVYRITVVGRSIKAINYRHRSAPTRLDFRGTSLAPQAGGEAEVQSKQGVIHVDAEFKHLPDASTFGPEYLTYVLWAISPEGRPLNLGEVLLNSSGHSKLNVTSDLQSFALLVTAEPYFSVTQPSDVVVMENAVTDDTNGTIEEVDAKYELLPRGQYSLNVSASELQPIQRAPTTPIELDEARNAVRIAEWAGADRYAAESLNKAKSDLTNAESLQASHQDRKGMITLARQAVQTAEDARVIAVNKQTQEQQAQLQKQAADAQAQAAQTQAEAQQLSQQKAQADAERQAAVVQQQQAQAQAEQSREAADAAQEEAQQSAQRAEQAENERAQMRAKLLQQLNTILQTRDTQRGLVVNMPDVLFDSGKYALKPSAREKLAKVAGVLQAYPGLTVEVDGYTDNRGGESLNQTLSDKRAEAVRDYLVSQGVSSNAIRARGFGEANAVTSNDTTLGRQLNRRVELILSGEVIGAQVHGETPLARAER